MKYNSSLHSVSHLIKAVLGTLEQVAKIQYQSDELIVLNYHETPKRFIKEFEKHVQTFMKNFRVIGPDDLESFFAGKLKSDKCCLLFTFDDGLSNNRYAAEILNKYQIKAYFFIVPDFINTPKSDQKTYYTKNIRPAIVPELYETEADFQSLDWSDIDLFIKSGHAVGSHTFSHTLIAVKSDANNSAREILESKKYLEGKLNCAIEAFCSINDTVLSVGRIEKQLIRENYLYHFTTLPGSNIYKDKLFIRRRNVEVFWLMGAVYFAIGNVDLRRWRSKINAYENM